MGGVCFEVLWVSFALERPCGGFYLGGVLWVSSVLEEPCGWVLSRRTPVGGFYFRVIIRIALNTSYKQCRKTCVVHILPRSIR